MINVINFIKTLLLKHKINSGNNGIEFNIAKTQKEKEAVYKLRYDVYCREKKYLKEENYSESLEYDIFDKFATHFIARDGDGEVVGSLRLIPRVADLSTKGKIPLEDHTNISRNIEDSDQVCELSRFVIKKEYRKKYSINFGLVKMATLYALERDITHFAISVSIKSKLYFEKFGFKQIGKEYIYGKIQYNHPSVTMLANIKESLKRMKEINISFYNYFINK